jgi:hypothetical protein
MDRVSDRASRFPRGDLSSFSAGQRGAPADDVRAGSRHRSEDACARAAGVCGGATGHQSPGRDDPRRLLLPGRASVRSVASRGEGRGGLVAPSDDAAPPPPSAARSTARGDRRGEGAGGTTARRRPPAPSAGPGRASPNKRVLHLHSSVTSPGDGPGRRRGPCQPRPAS